MPGKRYLQVVGRLPRKPVAFLFVFHAALVRGGARLHLVLTGRCISRAPRLYAAGKTVKIPRQKLGRSTNYSARRFSGRELDKAPQKSRFSRAIRSEGAGLRSRRSVVRIHWGALLTGRPFEAARGRIYPSTSGAQHRTPPLACAALRRAASTTVLSSGLGYDQPPRSRFTFDAARRCIDLPSRTGSTRGASARRASEKRRQAG